eukprot:COSAG06_NODE_1211_length_10245_cov_5.120244_2_plen_369_part_00
MPCLRLQICCQAAAVSSKLSWVAVVTRTSIRFPIASAWSCCSAFISWAFWTTPAWFWSTCVCSDACPLSTVCTSSSKRRSMSSSARSTVSFSGLMVLSRSSCSSSCRGVTIARRNSFSSVSTSRVSSAWKFAISWLTSSRRVSAELDESRETSSSSVASWLRCSWISLADRLSFSSRSAIRRFSSASVSGGTDSGIFPEPAMLPALLPGPPGAPMRFSYGREVDEEYAGRPPVSVCHVLPRVPVPPKAACPAAPRVNRPPGSSTCRCARGGRQARRARVWQWRGGTAGRGEVRGSRARRESARAPSAQTDMHTHAWRQRGDVRVLLGPGAEMRTSGIALSMGAAPGALRPAPSPPSTGANATKKSRGK